MQHTVTIPFGQEIYGINKMSFESKDEYPPAPGLYTVDRLSKKLIPEIERGDIASKIMEIDLTPIIYSPQQWRGSRNKIWYPRILVFRLQLENGDSLIDPCLLILPNNDLSFPIINIGIEKLQLNINKTKVVKQEKHSTETTDITINNEDEKTCIICMDNNLTHAFIECGHKCVCKECGDNILSSSQKCPICRANVKSQIRIFE